MKTTTHGTRERPYQATRFWFWQHASFGFADGYVINCTSLSRWWDPRDWWDVLSSRIAPTATKGLAPSPATDGLPSHPEPDRVPGGRDIIEIMPRQWESLHIRFWQTSAYLRAGYTINTVGVSYWWNPLEWLDALVSRISPKAVKTHPWTPDPT